MAQKGYPVNPPPYSSYPPPGAHNTIIVQQQQPKVITKSSRSLIGQISNGIDNMIVSTLNIYGSFDKAFPTTTGPTLLRGLFGQIGHELNQLGRVVSREVDWTADQINKSLATTAQGNLLKLFQSGNVVQLVSRSSGRSLEIVQSAQGQLVVDGLGQDGAPNATWTVVNEGSNQIRLHNNNNFLSIVNGSIVLAYMPAGTVHGIETKFQLTQVGLFVHLESLKERGKHVGILPSGQLKPALATGKEQHSMFGVKLLHSPYSVAH